MNRSEAGKLGALASQENRRKHQVVRLQASIAKFEARNLCCKYCSKPIPYERRFNAFCNQSCAALKHNSTRTKNVNNCRTCEIPLKTHTSKFCSVEHAQLFIYRAYIGKWLAGDVAGGTWRKVSAHVRHWLVEQYGEKCSECGWAKRHPVTGNIPVQVDHMDGNPDNHSPSNVRLLCPSCHSLTPTFGSLNKGCGRQRRYINSVIK